MKISALVLFILLVRISSGIIASDGFAHITFASDKDQLQRGIKHVVLDPSKLSDCSEDFVYSGSDEVTRLLFQACKEGNLNLLHAVLENSKVNESVDVGGRSPLIWAARYNHPQILEALLQSGADANAASRYGCTSLMWAARNGNCVAIKALLSYRACVHAVNEDGDTALDEAVSYNHLEAARILRVW